MKLKLLFFILTAFSFGLKAQTTNSTANASTEPNPAEVKGGRYGFSLKAGTMGFGAEFAASLNAKRTIALRVGGSTLPITYSGLELPVEGTTVVADINGRLGNGFLMFDFHPFGNAFKLTFGGAYMMTNINGVARLRDTIQQGLLLLSPEQVGTITLDLKPATIAPYAGIGFGRAIPKNRVGFGFEIGAYYIGEPQLTFKTTKLLEPTSDQEAVLQEGLSPYKFLPQLMFNLTFKLSK